MREMRPFICNDIRSDERMLPWRDGALRRGFQSSAAFPLVAGGKCLGTINLYSGEAGAFRDDEVRVLASLASNLTLAVERAREASRVEESEKRYRDMLDGMLEGCQLIGRDWRYVYVNDAAARHGRAAKEELLGRKMWEAYPGIEKTGMFRFLKRCMEKRSPHVMENEFAFPDGTKGWFQLSIQPTPGGIFILSQDITERKMAENALRESEERYRTLAEAAHDVIFTVGEDYRVTYINETGANMRGLPREKIVGQTLDELFGPDAVAGQKENILEVFRSGKPLYNERIMHFPDGDKWLATWLTPLKSKAGGVSLVMGLSRDVSERKVAQYALMAEKELVERFLNMAGFMVVVLDKDGKVARINGKGCKVLGRSEKDILGKNWFDNFIPAPMRAKMRAIFRKIMKERGRGGFEFYQNPILTKDGREVQVRWHNAVVRDRRGRPLWSISAGEEP
ncbi:MAG: PAS domain S-box protein [Candidatus Micrarchaeota archaeon]